ncbi:MAG TPA: GAF domain-containing protein [Longimicrobium sp.]|nr:GAF domain-containing protein [Longimicrobium sp.]
MTGDDVLRSTERLAEIAALDLLSPEVDAILQELVARASERLGLPTALVSIVLDEAQYFLAHHGLGGWQAEARGTPVEWSFCAHAVRSGRPFVVEDATTHPLTRDNPQVTLEDLRCYAGVPLVSARGQVLGTLCVAGTEAHTFSDDDLAALRALAAEAVSRLEARRKPAAGHQTVSS